MGLLLGLIKCRLRNDLGKFSTVESLYLSPRRSPLFSGPALY